MNFDWFFYKNYNSLNHISNRLQAIKHYNEIGKSQDLICSLPPTQIINLTFNEIETYFNNYMNDFIKTIINNNINEYHFKFNNNIRGRPKNTSIRTYGEKYNIAFFANNIINKKIQGYCIQSNKMYDCDIAFYGRTFFLTYNSMYYLFNSTDFKNKFLIAVTWEYFNPLYIFYPSQNIIYNISIRYNTPLFARFLTRELNLVNSFTRAIKNNNNITYYAIGVIQNIGHYFWNEIGGILFIIDNNLIDYIDNFHIYKFDFLNFGDILKNKFNKNITYDETIIGKNMLLSKKFLNKSLITLFKKLYDISENNNKDDKIHILFDIRTNSRICMNQSELIIVSINYIIDNYKDKEFEFYISGWYETNDNHINIQNDIFNNIQESFNFKINNLIGYKLIDIIKILNNIDLVISNTGSGSGFFYSIIYNKYHITFTHNKFHDEYFEQNSILNIDKNNIDIVDKKYITDNTPPHNFIIDINHVCELIKKRINMLCS
jgi:hypothetical protein